MICSLSLRKQVDLVAITGNTSISQIYFVISGKVHDKKYIYSMKCNKQITWEYNKTYIIYNLCTIINTFNNCKTNFHTHDFHTIEAIVENDIRSTDNMK